MGDRRRFFLWSAATAATGAWHAFGTLLFARWRWARRIGFLSRMLDHFVAVFSRSTKRGFANASIVAGMALGPAFRARSLAEFLMTDWGRPIFLVVGLTSLLWLLPWFRWMPKAIGIPLAIGTLRAGMLQILEQRRMGNMCRFILYELLCCTFS